MTRRTAYELKKAEERAHVLEGLVKALDQRQRTIIKVAAEMNKKWHIQLPDPDLAYLIEGTPEFWNSVDLIGGESTYFLGGAFNDGKGQPSQSNAVSHGCVPTRHRGVNVINTGAA